MSDHFAAFSFVDRITEFVPGVRAKARFAVPAEQASFPSCLLAEAVGQLAAWAAMAHIDFRGRPVAALATETRFHRDAKPGQTLDLGVEIDSCDDEAVAYHGSAHADGALLIELIDCLGPMLPVEDFDAPAAMKERLALLCGPGAVPGRFHGIVPPRVDAGTLVPEDRRRPRCTSPRRRRSSPTTFRAGRCFPRRYCSTHRSASRCGSRRARTCSPQPARIRHG